MLFVGIAILIALALALLVSMDLGALAGLGQMETSQAVAGLVILLVLASSMFSRRISFRSLAGGVVAWVGIFAIIILGYSYRTEVVSNVNRIWAELLPDQGVVSEDGRVVSFQRGIGRSFYVTAKVNQSKLRMIFDTGASAVVLSYEDAQHAGIDVERLQFVVPVQTANGTGRAAVVTLNQIGIGGIERQNISAFVAAKGALETSLLGMTFLETLESYTVTPETLEFRG